MERSIDPDTLDFEKGGGLVPAVVQDARTGRVLMLGYMNRAALDRTLATGRVTFFSRSRQALWTKGETSGHVLTVEEIRADCDRDTLLVRAVPAGPVCHTGADTCFDEANVPDGLAFLRHLEGVIRDRHAHPAEGSYTSKLFARGINKIAQKVGEEAVELVIEAKDDDDALFRAEAADLLYHLLVLFEAKGIPLDDVLATLRERHR
ncbi:MAG: histidine biosynthesis bifunctional protein HisIE [Rhodothermaceae bacterium]|nr:MAG: histidine biosynthesis bifunctional protein HisIE [Rhodothermaceae bacterium]